MIVKSLQIWSAKPHGIGIIPSLEMAKWTEIKAAQEKIKGYLSNAYENENPGKLRHTNNTEILLKSGAVRFTSVPPP